MKRFFGIILNLLIASAAFASEAGGEAHGPDFMGLFWRVVVFAVFAFILYKVLKNPVSKFLAGRTADIEKAIKDAEKAKLDAEAELKDYKSKLSLMNKELEEMKEKAFKAAEAEKERIIEEADKNIEKLKHFASSMIEADLNRAKDELKQETFKLALKLAEEKLGTTITEEKQNVLMKEYIKKIGAVN